MSYYGNGENGGIIGGGGAAPGSGENGGIGGNGKELNTISVPFSKRTRFPILGELDEIPWATIAPHESQALKNHYQTLKKLAERGGLAWSEALAILEDRPYTKMNEKEAKHKVILIVSKKCIVCGKPLQLGRFAHNQNTCWECFKMEVLEIKTEVVALRTLAGQENARDAENILNYMGAILAERFGEEW